MQTYDLWPFTLWKILPTIIKRLAHSVSDPKTKLPSIPIFTRSFFSEIKPTFTLINKIFVVIIHKPFLRRRYELEDVDVTIFGSNKTALPTIQCSSK